MFLQKQQAIEHHTSLEYEQVNGLTPLLSCSDLSYFKKTFVVPLIFENNAMYWGLDDVSKWFIIKVYGIKTKPYLSNNNLDI